MAVRALLLAITAAFLCCRTVILVRPEFSPLLAVSEWFHPGLASIGW
jgi:hypothetical protein